MRSTERRTERRTALRRGWILLPVLALSLGAQAQVLPPQEITDPKIRELQQKYLPELKLIAQAALVHHYPYHFYFSRKLDLAEKNEPGSDQRSIQFDHHQDKVVLKITGNYFAAYSTTLMSPEERARQTYEDVMLPLLQAAAPALVKVDELQAFAFEISHHVRKKIMGVSSEGVENVVLILPKASAERFAQASGVAAQRAALAEGEVFLNAVPVSLWPRPEGAAAAGIEARLTSHPLQPLPKSAVEPVVIKESALTSPDKRDTSPEALKNLQKLYQAKLDRMVAELNPQAHFVPYAPPAFIPFHNDLYLQISFTTTLSESATSSQYKLAALAFDQHIAHLIRPTLASFHDDNGDFDGIDFSTSLRLTVDPAVEGGSVAVEFIFPLSKLRAYAQFDCTGQQLIDVSFVLINGERVSLNLQVAEAASPTK